MNKQITQLLPDNIHKRIAEYLQPIEFQGTIVIYKYTGCKIKNMIIQFHVINAETLIILVKFLYIVKKSNPILMNYYINQLKRNCIAIVN